MQRQYITTRLARAAATLLMLAFVTACEKPILDEKGGEVPTEANVILRFVQNEWTEQREPFELARKWPSRDGQRQSQHEAFSVGSRSAAVTRAATDITELCSRLNIAVFNADGTNLTNRTKWKENI